MISCYKEYSIYSYKGWSLILSCWKDTEFYINGIVHSKCKLPSKEHNYCFFHSNYPNIECTACSEHMTNEVATHLRDARELLIATLCLP